MRRTESGGPPRLPTALKGLADLAYNLWWSWDPGARDLWEELARRAGRRTADPGPLNPVEILEGLRRRDLEELSGDGAFLDRFRRVRARFYRALSGPGRGFPGVDARHPVAYLCMEFGVDTSVPIYAGGLGILAGDHLKAASDVGLPMVGIGLIYRHGYFRQELDRRGRQRVVYPRADYGKWPVRLLRDRRGRELHVVVELPAAGRREPPRRVKLRVWGLRVGRTPVYLLDSDFPGNAPRERRLSRHLYGGSREDRVAQEVLVGIGAVRLLRALEIEPALWHHNEGHVVFSALERIRELVTAKRSSRRPPLSFHEAVEVVAADTVFTTHTPVPEGNEIFDLQLARRYLEPQCDGSRLGVDDFLDLGLDWDAAGRPSLSMTVLALHLSRLRNGVSQMHGEVSRRMWHHLWPDFPVEEVPITSVTNGVHVPTWIAPEMDGLLRKHVSRNWRNRLDRPDVWGRARQIPDRELWRTKNLLRARLVRLVRERVRRRHVRNGLGAAAARRQADSLLDPEALTIGFARRFALYKRAALIFQDVDRARALFNNPRRPVQIIFAGKPHPEDPAGKRLLEKVVALSRRPEFRGKVVVLENYDIDVGRALVQGVDVWLNNPRFPEEASGTSGQKVPPNGGLNVSIRDGWWYEAYAPAVGWTFGEPRPYEDQQLQDRNDGEALLRVLGREVVPLFYRRGRDGVPRGWVGAVKRSMAELIPRFNTVHMVREYWKRLYRPAAENGLRARARDFQLAREIASWKGRVARCWPMVHLRNLESRTRRGRRILEAEVFLAGLSGQDVSARAGWSGSEGRPPTAVREAGAGIYRFQFPLHRGRAPLRVRIWPSNPALPNPSELGLAYEVEAT